MPAARMGVFLVLITRNHRHDSWAKSKYMYISVGVGEVLPELQWYGVYASYLFIGSYCNDKWRSIWSPFQTHGSMNQFDVFSYTMFCQSPELVSEQLSKLRDKRRSSGGGRQRTGYSMQYLHHENYIYIYPCTPTSTTPAYQQTTYS